MTSDQLEEPEISEEEEEEEEICQKGTLRGGSLCWAPAWGEVRDINHTSQLPVSALSSVPSQKPSYPARGGVSVGMGEGPRSWKPAAGLGMGISWEGASALIRVMNRAQGEGWQGGSLETSTALGCRSPFYLGHAHSHTQFAEFSPANQTTVMCLKARHLHRHTPSPFPPAGARFCQKTQRSSGDLH